MRTDVVSKIISKRDAIFSENFIIFFSNAEWKCSGIRISQILEDHFLEMYVCMYELTLEVLETKLIDDLT